MRALLLACAVTLAACSSGSDAPPPASSPDATAPAPGPDSAPAPDSARPSAELAASPEPAPGAPATPPPAAPPPAAPPPGTDSAPAPSTAGRVVEVNVGADGFAPAQIALPAGVPSRLVFTRTSEATCATSVQSPALGVEATPLPLGEPVSVEVTPQAAGEFRIACGMDMVSAVIVAE